jgi:hypothetical protein
MFGDMMGNLEEQQKQLQEELKKVKIKSNAGDGAIEVEMNGAMEVQNISLDPEKIDLSDPEALEDLLIVAMNRAIGMARESEQKASQEMLNKMMPGGMDSLKNMLGL